MTDHLTPVEVCERFFGGPAGIAEILDYDRTAPFGWRHASKTREAGDLPSTSIQRKLLAAAKARRKPLTADMLILGASEDEIAALLRVEAAE